MHGNRCNQSPCSTAMEYCSLLIRRELIAVSWPRSPGLSLRVSLPQIAISRQLPFHRDKTLWGQMTHFWTQANYMGLVVVINIRCSCSNKFSKSIRVMDQESGVRTPCIFNSKGRDRWCYIWYKFVIPNPRCRYRDHDTTNTGCPPKSALNPIWQHSRMVKSNYIILSRHFYQVLSDLGKSSIHLSYDHQKMAALNRTLHRFSPGIAFLGVQEFYTAYFPKWLSNMQFQLPNRVLFKISGTPTNVQCFLL